MGYDCDILAYDEDMHFIGFVIEDYSLAWIREFNSFMLQNGHKIQTEYDTYFDSKIATKFLYDCEKNGLCKEPLYRISIEVAKIIKENRNIRYIKVSCC